MTAAAKKDKGGEHPFGDTGQFILFCLFVVVWGGDSFLLRKTTFLSHWVPLSVRLVILALALVASAWLVASAYAAVGAERPSRGLVSAGPFRYVRHPLYLGCVLFYLGPALSTASLLSLALVAVIFVFYNYIAGYEERLLEERFGEAYGKYKTATGKWVPRIGRGR